MARERRALMESLETICVDEVPAPRSRPITVRQGNGGLYKSLTSQAKEAEDIASRPNPEFTCVFTSHMPNQPKASQQRNTMCHRGKAATPAVNAYTPRPVGLLHDAFTAASRPFC